ncbi:hypothetical protein [Ornithinimicrobium kibberense]|uniref:hypothetical protein n=1 Tax=Ornithinimicrobium kibberense TaxID=282060 RepID=UPI003607DC5E
MRSQRARPPGSPPPASRRRIPAVTVAATRAVVRVRSGRAGLTGRVPPWPRPRRSRPGPPRPGPPRPRRGAEPAPRRCSPSPEGRRRPGRPGRGVPRARGPGQAGRGRSGRRGPGSPRPGPGPWRSGRTPPRDRRRWTARR